MPREDFIVDYALEGANESMDVVGHMEQMRVSRCYLESDTLTCTTCHDPHGQPTAEESLAYYRQKCVACHQPETCGLPAAERLQREADDNCVSCHMPRAQTEIPHFAFTHHRIGVYKTPPGDYRPPSSGELTAISDVSHLPEVERQRCLGLGYKKLFEKAGDPRKAEPSRERSVRLLESVVAAGLQDPEVDAALARLYVSADPQRSITCAHRALEHRDALTPRALSEAQTALALGYFDSRRLKLAAPALEESVKLYRSAGNWLVLAMCRGQLGDKSGAFEAARQAVSISPTNVEALKYLADLYRARGDYQRSFQLLRQAEIVAPRRDAATFGPSQ